MVQKKDDYGREVPSHGESRHEEHMYALYGNKAAPPVEQPPTILQKALMDIAKMDTKLAGETAQAMVTLMGRTMEQHHASGTDLAQKQQGVVNTFLFDSPASPAGKNILMQMTVEQVTGEPYKAPTASATAPTATLNSPKNK